MLVYQHSVYALLITMTQSNSCMQTEPLTTAYLRPYFDRPRLGGTNASQNYGSLRRIIRGAAPPHTIWHHVCIPHGLLSGGHRWVGGRLGLHLLRTRCGCVDLLPRYVGVEYSAVSTLFHYFIALYGHFLSLLPHRYVLLCLRYL